MRVIAVKPLRAFWSKHSDAKVSLQYWIQAAKSANWKSFADVRATFATASVHGRLTIFNIGGNKYRLIVVIHYNTQRVYVRHILTHAEYDAGNWK
jgi:mRNA interferase HigB